MGAMSAEVASFARSAPRVALVFPPYGPRFIPSLGLASLSAGVKRRGFACRTLYWNLSFRREIPHPDAAGRAAIYDRLANELWPLDEWVFTPQLFPDHRIGARGLAQHAARLIEELDRRGEPPGTRPRGAGIAFRRRRHRTWRTLFEELRERAGEQVKAVADRLADDDIVGIQSSYFQNTPALALAREVKRRWPEKVLVLGGANCESTMGRVLEEEFAFVDYVIAGEADLTFPELVARLHQRRSLDGLAGLLHRDASGEVVESAPAAPVVDLDALPTPDYDDYVSERRRAGDDAEAPLALALESSRGCWWGAKHHCTFCALNGTGMAFREKSVSRTLAEIDEIVARYDVRFLAMTDNILSMRQFRELTDRLRQRRVRLRFFYEAKSNLHRHQVRALADAGIDRIQPGIESFSTPLLRALRKGARGIQNVALLKFAREHGVNLTYGLLGGVPGEDPEEYRRMARLARALVHLPAPAGVFEITYERFSPFHSNPAEFGIALRPSPGYSLLYPFAFEVLERLAYHFERTDTPSLAHLDELRERVARWREAERIRPAWLGGGVSLTWTYAADGVVVHDRRPGFPRTRYRLRDHAARVFLDLDGPARLDALVERARSGAGRANRPWAESQATHVRGAGWRPWAGRERSIAFTRDDFVRDSAACLRPLVDAGLVYVEDETCLALPVARVPRVDLEWPGLSARRPSSLVRDVAAAVRIAWRDVWPVLARRWTPARASAAIAPNA